MQSQQNKANAMKRIMKPIRAQAWVSAHPLNILHLSDVFLFLICFSIKLNTIMSDYTSKTPSDSSCYTTHPTSSWKLKRPPLFFFSPCIISHAQVINLHTLNGSYTPPARLLLPIRFFFLSFFFFFFLIGCDDNYTWTQREWLKQWRGRKDGRIQMKEDGDKKQAREARERWVTERKNAPIARG